MKMKIIIIAIMSLLLLVSVFAWSGEVWMDFDEGWNLVYGFQSPDQIQGLESSHIKAIYAFVPTTQEYIRAWPDPNAKAWQNLDNIYDDHELLQTAYWVYTDKGANTEYWLYDAPKPIEEHQIYKGWNFIGITPDLEGRLETVVGSCNVLRSYVFDNEHQKWVEFPLTQEFSRSMVGYGWVIKVSDNCFLGEVAPPDVDVGAPPPIPN